MHEAGSAQRPPGTRWLSALSIVCNTMGPTGPSRRSGPHGARRCTGRANQQPRPVELMKMGLCHPLVASPCDYNSLLLSRCSLWIRAGSLGLREGPASDATGGGPTTCPGANGAVTCCLAPVSQRLAQAQTCPPPPQLELPLLLSALTLSTSMFLSATTESGPCNRHTQKERANPWKPAPLSPEARLAQGDRQSNGKHDG